MQALQQTIEEAFDTRASGFDERDRVEAAVAEALGMLD